MDISLIISIISMLATVGSFLVAIKANKEAKQAKNEVINIRNMIKNTDKSNSNYNRGKNTGVMARNISGGVNIGK